MTVSLSLIFYLYQKPKQQQTNKFVMGTTSDTKFMISSKEINTFIPHVTLICSRPHLKAPGINIARLAIYIIICSKCCYIQAYAIVIVHHRKNIAFISAFIDKCALHPVDAMMQHVEV